MEPKILHVVNSFLPPTQKWLEILLTYLDPKSEIFAKYIFNNAVSSFSVREFSKADLVRNNLSNPSFLNRLLLKSVYRRNKFSEEVHDLVATEKHDIIHAHFADIACDLLDLKLTDNQKLVCSFYGWDYEMLPHVKSKYVERYKLLFEKAAFILTEGPHGKGVLEGKGCAPEKIIVAPLGIEMNEVRKPKSKETGNLRLVQIASFREKKGQLYTVRALHKLIQSNRTVSLTLIGDNGNNDYYQEVMAEIEKLNLKDHILIKNFVKYELIEEELDKHDVFIQPSCYAANMDCEGGAPTTLFNALNVGLPIIAIEHCDIPYVVTHDLTGKIVKEKDVDLLAEAIESFYVMSDEQYKRYSEECISDVRQRFNIKSNAQRLTLIYQDIKNNTAHNISINE